MLIHFLTYKEFNNPGLVIKAPDDINSYDTKSEKSHAIHSLFGSEISGTDLNNKETEIIDRTPSINNQDIDIFNTQNLNDELIIHKKSTKSRNRLQSFFQKSSKNIVKLDSHKNKNEGSKSNKAKKLNISGWVCS